jgi:protease-4
VPRRIPSATRIGERDGGVFLLDDASEERAVRAMIDPNPQNWERTVLEKVALKALDEQRRSRQWGALFKLLWFTFAFLVFAAAMGWLGRPDKEGAGSASLGKHTAVVDVEGVIGSESKASAERVIKGLNRAFKDSNTQGVLVRINSPAAARCRRATSTTRSGGCARSIPGTPIHAVVEDICASAATTSRWPPTASTSTRRACGLHRRDHGRASASSARWRSWASSGAPNTPARTRISSTRSSPRIRATASNAKQYAGRDPPAVHQGRRQGRQGRLKENPETFSGSSGAARRAWSCALADAFGSAEYVAREVFKAEKLVEFTGRGEPVRDACEALRRRLRRSLRACAATAARAAAMRLR